MSAAPGPAQPRQPVLPGATLGVLGGGQLGRMFVQAAQAMGYATAVLDADAQSPAGLIAQQHIRADYLDAQGLRQLAEASAALTTEFENVPAAALQALAATRPVAPAAAAVAVCQDRAAEKAQFLRCGVPCAPHALIDSEAALAAVDPALLPGILKTARLGYDGKGQQRVADAAALAAAWQALGHVPCLLEQQLPLALELSVVAARGADGQVVCLPVQQNLHRDGILALTQVPAPDADDRLQQQARDYAQQLAAALDYVGVLCVEFFVLSEARTVAGGLHGRLVANEMAPRPHNSGHWSIDGADICQFQLQVRTLAGLPLVTPRQHSAAVMLNLLGELWLRGAEAGAAGDAGGQTVVEPDWPALLALPGVHLHLYGKATPRRGRKMGHLTVTADSLPAARATAQQAAALLGLPAF